MNRDASNPAPIPHLGLSEVLALLLYRRSWILVSVVVGTLVFGVAAVLIRPVYRASALLSPVVPEGSEGPLGSADVSGLAALAGINLSRSNNNSVEEALAVFRSRQFTDAFIAEKGLAARFFPAKWDATTRAWRVSADDRPTPAQTFEYFDTKVRTVTRDTKTGMVTVRVDWFEPDETAEWCNELVQRVNREMRRRSIDKASASLAFLQAELDGTSDIRTREAIYRLLEGQIKQRMLANVTEEFSFRVVDPAMIPDVHQPVRPQRALIAALGPVAGFALGVLIVLCSAIAVAAKESLRHPTGKLYSR